MICKRTIKKFCKDDISLIENYDKAIADKTQTWHCHHRRETIYSKSDLIEIGEYYNRPAVELIFLTHKEHISFHQLNNKNRLGKKLNEETKRKISESMKGKTRSKESKKKISESLKGKKRGPYKKKNQGT